MEPGHEDREYHRRPGSRPAHQPASMEPGHEDREYPPRPPEPGWLAKPQWSPVMKTGNTRRKVTDEGVTC